METKCGRAGCVNQVNYPVEYCEDHSWKKCRYLGCQELTIKSLCLAHADEVKAKRSGDRSRFERSKPGGDLYKTDRWHKIRAVFYRQNILCAAGLLFDRVDGARDVDHIVPHRGDKFLFYMKDNLQYLSFEAHVEKTKLERTGVFCDYANNVQFDGYRFRQINPYRSFDERLLKRLVGIREKFDGTNAKENHGVKR